jgi:NADP-dependent 3-hydroxy acid dehydrogenase YdfG
MDNKSVGKIALVAGYAGSPCVGIIKSFLEEGSTVILPAKSADEVAYIKNHLIEVSTGNLITLLTDLPDFDKAFDTAENIIQEFGRIDIAVIIFENNWFGPLLSEIDINEWQKVADKYITSYFVIGRVLLQLMKQQPYGMYVAVSDMESLMKDPHHSLANFAANAQIEIAKIFAEEMAATGVRYYHLFTHKSGLPEKTDPTENAPGLSPEILGQYIIQLYDGESSQFVHPF